MSNIPEEIQVKINIENERQNPTPVANHIQGSGEFRSYHFARSMGFNSGAVFGYSLALARIAELEREAELQVLLNSLPESIETKALGKCNLLIDKLKGKWMVCYVDAKTETAPFAKSTSVDLKVAAEEIIAKLNEHKDKIIQP